MKILDAVARHYAPDARVVSDFDREWSASALIGRCLQLNDMLQARAIRRLALCADNGPDWIAVDLTCQQHDITLVPLPTFFSARQKRFALDAMAAEALLTDSLDLAAGLSGARPVPVADSGLYLVELESPQATARLPAGTGKITFTSGSTGTPRGVCLSHRQQLRQASALREAVGLERPRHLCLLPLSTLLENVAGVYAPLYAKGEVVVPGLADLGFSGSTLEKPEALLHAISRALPTTLILVPQLLQVLVHATTRGWRPPASLRFIAVGGSRVPVRLLHQARALGLPVYEGYGLSECCSVVSLNTPARARTGSCGLPLSHLDVAITDGEVRVAGNAMLGYVGEPDSWYPDSVATGDLGYLDGDGYLHVEGRSKNLLISSFGRNISPEWVEAELLAHPGLAEAVVMGDTRPYCVALLTRRDPALTEADIAEWIDRVNSELPDYARVRRWSLLPGSLAGRRGLYTDNGRPRRAAIAAALANEIESLYAAEQVA